jgi:hypothetical protein
MSLAALSLLLGHVAIFGLVRDEDEGTAAHLFQILMAGQLPIIVFFAAKWLPRRPADAWRVLALQAFIGLLPFAALYWYEHS